MASMANALKSSSGEQHNDCRELYICKQDTNDLFIFDFQLKKLIRNSISQKIPVQSKSVQALNGNIYLIGGMQRSEQNNEN